MPVRYKTIEELKSQEGRRYYRNAIYPDVPVSEDDIYVISTGGDRYDTLAQQFYGDSRLWWVIASANTSKRDGLIVEPGIQLRIPANGPDILRQFEEFNEKR
jgi:hypothetical protein